MSGVKIVDLNSLTKMQIDLINRDSFDIFRKDEYDPSIIDCSHCIHSYYDGLSPTKNKKVKGLTGKIRCDVWKGSFVDEWGYCYRGET